MATKEILKNSRFHLTFDKCCCSNSFYQGSVALSNNTCLVSRKSNLGKLSLLGVLLENKETDLTANANTLT